MPVLRSVKNVVHNYTEAEVKVREATSNDPWGPSSTLMSQVADLTYNVVAFSEIMRMIWRRLNDHGKNWRHVYKALTLLEYIIKTGSDKVSMQCKENIFAIQTLKDFQYMEDNKDHGLSVRDKAKALVALLKDEERLKNERAKALKAKERFAQNAFGVGSNTQMPPVMKKTNLKYPVPESGPTYAEVSRPAPQSTGTASPPGRLAPDLAVALPSSAGEEELQLQLALAMSKEEADSEAKKRAKDDLKLRMALEESKKDQVMDTPQGQPMPTFAPPTTSPPQYYTLQAPPPVTNPWTGVTQPSASSPQQAPGIPKTVSMPTSVSVPTSAADPWGGGSTAASSMYGGDPWESNPPPVPPKNLDPWDTPSATEPTELGLQGNITGPVINDPWSPTLSAAPKNGASVGPMPDAEFDALINRAGPGSSVNPAEDPFDFGNMKQQLDPALVPSKDAEEFPGGPKNPQNFLGANANLVNLDNLIAKPQPTLGQGNPFGMTMTSAAAPAPGLAGNPFAANPSPRPSLNQMSSATTAAFSQGPALPNPLLPTGAAYPAVGAAYPPGGATNVSNPFL